MNQKLVNIAIPSSPNRLFTYLLPDGIGNDPAPGQRCIVPFGRKNVLGFFMEKTSNDPGVTLKPVREFVDTEPLFEPEFFQFLKWMSDYYLANIADVLYAALPPGLRKIKKSTSKVKKIRLSDVLLGYRLADSSIEDDQHIDIIKSVLRKNQYATRAHLIEAGITVYRFNKLVKEGALIPHYGLPSLFDYIKERDKVAEIEPNKEQSEAIKEVLANKNGFNPYLLFGITGSGKTLVYCHIAREMLRAGKSVLVLVPEIALAGTLLSYFRAFFDDDIALLHSGLTDRERTLVWHNIQNGKFRIVIGARSALFAPMNELGMIIVDEEHDESYKQDDPSPRFQGRDSAVMRAKMQKVPIILGSASPSIESMNNAEEGRYKLLKLTHRPEQAKIPLIRLLDLKEEQYTSNRNPFFTRIMTDTINRALDKGQQVILYLNRRGFSPKIKCTDCGHSPECPNCNITLSYHKAGNRLICHYCGFVRGGYNQCDNCEGDSFVYLGTGTQKIEDNLMAIAPSAKLIRLDSDSAQVRKKAHEILSDFAAKKYNLLLGTQMVSKGIDFPDVSLVGVLMADIGMDMPDFRADEKLFAKLLQVAGRSGRGIIPGEVVIQTYNPNSDLIDDAARQDYETFYNRELFSRKKLHYPPFSHLVNIRIAARKEADCEKMALEFRKNLEAKLNKHNIKVHLLGPASCPLYRLRGMYRRQMIIKTRQIMKLNRMLFDWQYAEPNYGMPSRIKIIVDIDPYDMM